MTEGELAYLTPEATTENLWLYDLRTNRHFTLKQNPLRYEHLPDFIETFRPGERHLREESERFRRFSYDDLIQRDKVSLDITWLRDSSLEDMDDLPPPDVIAQEIVDDLEAAIAEFAAVAASLAMVPTGDTAPSLHDQIA